MIPAAKQVVLLVDDEEKLLESIAQRMKLLGFAPLTATNGLAAIEIARQHPIALAIVDLKMPGMDGLVTIAKLKEINPQLDTILLTGHGNEKVRQATESLHSLYFQKDRMGDFWNFIKGLSEDGRVVVIRPAGGSAPAASGKGNPADSYLANEIEIRPDPQLKGREASVYGPASDPNWPGGAKRPRIVGETPAMQELRKNIERVAELDCTVIIRGETGVGKELTARAIHAMSMRADRRFLAINCGGLGNEQVLGKLLGYRNGQLSEAIRNQGGIFGSDPGGTLLFDHVEDLPDDLQIQLLKIIDATEVSRHHRQETESTDIRILVATHRDLMECVDAGKFRKDLYFRLNLFELTIPPLRDRKDDIAPLCSYFLDKYRLEFKKTVSGISQEVIDTFDAYDFPGNVRELEHIIERAVIIADGSIIEKRHLPARFQIETRPAPPLGMRQFATLAEVKARYLLEVLEATGGNKTRAAEILGISRAALWRYLKQLKADPSGR